MSSTDRDASAPIALEPAPTHSVAGWGTLLGCCSALCYTAANTCLRNVIDCDPIWVSCIKAVPMLGLVAPWLIWHRGGGRPLITSWREMAWVTIGAAGAQLLGNCLFQWSLGVVGLALAIPMTLGAVLIGSALLGGRLLGEAVSWRAWLSIGMLIFAIVVLSLGAQQAYLALHGGEDGSRWTVVAGMAGFVIAGLSYAALGASIRRATLRGLPQVTILLVTAWVGCVGLGGLVWWRHGWAIIPQTQPTQWSWMLCAGGFNALAFLALTGAIRTLGLLNVNALNASQTAMASIAGVVLFHEPVTWTLVVGVAVTIAGLLMMPRTSS